jgi:hypothetical protein
MVEEKRRQSCLSLGRVVERNFEKAAEARVRLRHGHGLQNFCIPVLP